MSITVVIGAQSTVSFEYVGCAISANWSMDPGRQDAFCLGSWDPSEEHIIYKPQKTLSITAYASGSSSTYSTTPSQGCEDAGLVSASVNAQTCEGGEPISGQWHVNSYSYSKESRDQPGQETWSMIMYKGASDILTGIPESNIAEPTWVVRGITQGQATQPSTNAGIDFDSTFAQSKSGSVSAGSQGRATTLTHGVVKAVGGGSNDSGTLGNGSASIPLTPLYI